MAVIILSIGLSRGHDLKKNILDEMDVSKSCVRKLCFPRIVWAYYSEEQPPEFVVEIIESNKNAVENFTYCILGPKNITIFLDIDMSHPKFNKLHPAGKGDYIRVRLLEKYGGIWTDISTFLNSGSEIEWFVFESLSSKSQFTSFKFNWHDVKLEFSFIGAPEKSPFMHRFRRELEIVLSQGRRRYVNETCHRLLFENITVPSVICVPYYFIDLAFLSIYSENSTSENNILLLPENRSNYRLYAECKYKGYCVVNRFIREPAVRKYPFIKLQSGLRRYLAYELKEHQKKVLELGEDYWKAEEEEKKKKELKKQA